MGADRAHLAPLPPGVDIALVTAFALPEQGGIQRSVDQVASGLGARVLVVAPPHAQASELDQTKPYHTWRRGIFTGATRPSWWWLVGWAKRQQTSGLRTVMFAHYSAACVAGLFLRSAGVQYVILVHGRDLLLEQRRWSWLVGLVLRRAAWVGVNSRFVADLVAAHGVPRASIIRTHPAVPDELVSARSIRSGSDLITVGRLVSRKNVIAVLRALPEIQRVVPNVHYHLVGDGPERTKLESLVSELKLSQVVTFHGQVADQRRTALLDQASCFVMVPTVAEAGADVEGLGLVYLEAAARGLPIVASSTGGVADIVQPGVTGQLVPPDDISALSAAIIATLRSTAAWSAAAQTLVQREFTWSVRNGRVAGMMGPVSAEIGVVIPAFQSAGQIGQTLHDVFAQTLPPVQVVVVDDGSTDNLAAAIQPWRGRIQLVQQPNQGAAAARNTGAAHITSEFIIFIDADIQLQPTMFEQLARTLKVQPEASYAYSSFRFGPKHFDLFDFDEARLRQMNYIHTTALIRRSDLLPFDVSLKKFQDWDLWLSMAAIGRRGVWVPARLFSVSQRGGTMSQWLPSFVYRLPGIGQGRGSAPIARYRAAEAIIRKKHQL